MTRKRDIYIAIMKAAALGKGLHLNPDEVYELSRDSAIETSANNGLSKEEVDSADNLYWEDVDPYKPRIKWNGMP